MAHTGLKPGVKVVLKDKKRMENNAKNALKQRKWRAMRGMVRQAERLAKEIPTMEFLVVLSFEGGIKFAGSGSLLDHFKNGQPLTDDTPSGVGYTNYNQSGVVGNPVPQPCVEERTPQATAGKPARELSTLYKNVSRQLIPEQLDSPTQNADVDTDNELSVCCSDQEESYRITRQATRTSRKKVANPPEGTASEETSATKRLIPEQLDSPTQNADVDTDNELSGSCSDQEESYRITRQATRTSRKKVANPPEGTASEETPATKRLIPEQLDSPTQNADVDTDKELSGSCSDQAKSYKITRQATRTSRKKVANPPEGTASEETSATKRPQTVTYIYVPLPTSANRKVPEENQSEPLSAKCLHPKKTRGLRHVPHKEDTVSMKTEIRHEDLGEDVLCESRETPTKSNKAQSQGSSAGGNPRFTASDVDMTGTSHTPRERFFHNGKELDLGDMLTTVESASVLNGYQRNTDISEENDKREEEDPEEEEEENNKDDDIEEEEETEREEVQEDIKDDDIEEEEETEREEVQEDIEDDDKEEEEETERDKEVQEDIEDDDKEEEEETERDKEVLEDIEDDDKEEEEAERKREVGEDIEDDEKEEEEEAEEEEVEEDIEDDDKEEEKEEENEKEVEEDIEDDDKEEEEEAEEEEVEEDIEDDDKEEEENEEEVEEDIEGDDKDEEEEMEDEEVEDTDDDDKDADYEEPSRKEKKVRKPAKQQKSQGSSAGGNPRFTASDMDMTGTSHTPRERFFHNGKELDLGDMLPSSCLEAQTHAENVDLTRKYLTDSQWEIVERLVESNINIIQTVSSSVEERERKTSLWRTIARTVNCEPSRREISPEELRTLWSKHLFQKHVYSWKRRTSKSESRKNVGTSQVFKTLIAKRGAPWKDLKSQNSRKGRARKPCDLSEEEERVYDEQIERFREVFTASDQRQIITEVWSEIKRKVNEVNKGRLRTVKELQQRLFTSLIKQKKSQSTGDQVRVGNNSQESLKIADTSESPEDIEIKIEIDDIDSEQREIIRVVRNRDTETETELLVSVPQGHLPDHCSEIAGTNSDSSGAGLVTVKEEPLDDSFSQSDTSHLDSDNMGSQGLEMTVRDKTFIEEQVKTHNALFLDSSKEPPDNRAKAVVLMAMTGTLNTKHNTSYTCEHVTAVATDIINRMSHAHKRKRSADGGGPTKRVRVEDSTDVSSQRPVKGNRVHSSRRAKGDCVQAKHKRN